MCDEGDGYNSFYALAVKESHELYAWCSRSVNTSLHPWLLLLRAPDRASSTASVTSSKARSRGEGRRRMDYLCGTMVDDAHAAESAVEQAVGVDLRLERDDVVERAAKVGGGVARQNEGTL